ncbi:hypothetical protein OS125_10800 [Corynebacterium sp. P7003]|uniref:Secreted protein n=1 Tax=Corynebacterium pygosceleis TaxID=2800406 RepID=A0ABT3WU22_9CORY|nr:hypothetical protein [Corynebacterium pygosceleis]MCX7445720.1 hypothetical protein [Corynebacterium pygosceleis]
MRGGRAAPFLCAPALVVALTSCTIPTGERGDAVEDAPVSATTSREATPWVTGDTPTTSRAPELQRAADRISAAAVGDGGVGVALDDGRDTVTAGTVLTGPAWSTVKIPVSMAVLFHGAGDTDIAETVDRAVTSSDNAAFDTLWYSLGGGVDAATATERILRRAGDDTTVTPEITRPGFSAAGQTPWALSDQAGFAQRLTCVPGAGAVLTAMNGIVDDQSYGLGRVPDLPFKGGWGPDENGDYLVRQFGVLRTPGGHLGVALAVRPDDGTYDTGREMLDRMARALGTEIDAGTFVDAAECEPESPPEDSSRP